MWGKGFCKMAARFVPCIYSLIYLYDTLISQVCQSQKWLIGWLLMIDVIGANDWGHEWVIVIELLMINGTQAIITGAFVICWLPFFVIAVLFPICDSCHFSDAMLSFFLWLGYFNSTLNPILYTIFSPEFRNAFQKLLHIDHRVKRKFNHFEQQSIAVSNNSNY